MSNPVEDTDIVNLHTNHGEALPPNGLHIDTIEIHDIQPIEDLSKIDNHYVTILMQAIRLQGLQQPILLGHAPGRYIIIDGAHRLAAVSQLGWPEISAIVVEARSSEPETEFAVRAGMTRLFHKRPTILQNAQDLNLLAGCDAHEDQPDLRAAGSPTRLALPNLQALALPSATAEVSGLSKRRLRRLLNIAARLCPSVQARISGTWVADHFQSLEQLAELTAADQHAVCDRLFATPPRSKSVQDARGMIKANSWLS